MGAGCAWCPGPGGDGGFPDTQTPPWEEPAPSTALSPHPVNTCSTSKQVRAPWRPVLTSLVLYGGSAQLLLLLLPRSGNKAPNSSCRGLLRTTPAMPGFDSSCPGTSGSPDRPGDSGAPRCGRQEMSRTPPTLLPSSCLPESLSGGGSWGREGCHFHSEHQLLGKLKSAILCL